jgi:hypothetical protein
MCKSASALTAMSIATFIAVNEDLEKSIPTTIVSIKLLFNG